MKDFDSWFKELTSDTIWHEQMQMVNKNKDFKAGCEKLWGNLVSDPDLMQRPMKEHRRHLHNILFSMPVIKQNWIQTHQVEEKKVEPEYQPVTGEERLKWLERFKKAVESAPIIRPVRKLTSQQLEEEGQVRPKSVQFHRSEMDTRLGAIEAAKDARKARRQMFIDVYADATEDEIEAYLKKFAHVDDPDKLL